MAINIGGLVRSATDFLPGSLGAVARATGGIDLTPGFNIDSSAGGGIPFISRGNGSTGIAPATTAAPSSQGNTQNNTSNTSQTAQNSGPIDPTAAAQAAQDAQARANALFGIDSGLTSANDALGRLDSTAATGNANIDKQYQDAYNRLDATHKLGDAQYQQNTTSQLNDYQAARNKSADAARNFLEAARRTLGAQGAGGGSAARYGLPLEAQTMATNGNADAQATNNHNIIALDQGHRKDENAFTNNVNDIITQRDQGKNDYQTQIANQRAQLLNTVAQLTGQRTIANGGDYKAALAAANPYTSQLPAIMDRIQALAATPEVKAQQYTLATPDLSSYNFARPDAAPVAQQDPTLAQPGFIPTYDPNQQQQQNPIASLFGLQDPNQQQFA